MRVQARTTGTGTAEPWDPGNPGPFIELAGDQFLGTFDGKALIRTGDGHEMYIHPGWCALRLEEHPDSPARFIASDLIGEHDGAAFAPLP